MSYTLYYFNLRGRAELIRYLFAEAGQEYEDIRVRYGDIDSDLPTSDEWKEFKPKTPMGQLPVLEYEGKIIGQGKAIARFVANKLGLTSDNEWERAEMDSWVDLGSDFVAALLNYQSEKARYAEAFKNKTLNHILPYYEKALENEFLVGTKVSWADLAFLVMMEIVCLDKVSDILGHDLRTTFPNCFRHMKRIADRPNIAEWRSTRPATPF